MNDYNYSSNSKLKKLTAIIKEKFGKREYSYNISNNQLCIKIKKDILIYVLNTLKEDKDLDFKQLIDICAVDYPNKEDRFEIVYHLLSLGLNQRIRIKVLVKDGEILPSVVSCYSAANWFEREIWDLFGIVFSGHPDLRRILTDYGFEGYPLRKDFPLTGFVEVSYDDIEKRVINQSVDLTQDFRTFDFESPWEGTEYIVNNEVNKKEK
jgi:NADH-quinone oxidoreductase subunit C